jgi:branched-chain amino acid transport system ATP-binding protein
MVLSVENIKVRYPSGAIGVSDVSIEAEAGQVIAIFGPNGAGKTTTVRAISGFMRSERVKVNGRVTLFGRDATSMEPQATMRLGVAFVPERRKIFGNMTVAENLQAVGRRPPRARRNQIYERIYALFPMLKDRQHHSAGLLSGGQQQMLAIARSLMCEARLLIIDEMTLGLHHSMHVPLFEVVKELAADGTTVIVVDESTGMALTIADHCYLLGNGQVKLHGPPELFVGNELLAAGYVEPS